MVHAPSSRSCKCGCAGCEDHTIAAERSCWALVDSHAWGSEDGTDRLLILANWQVANEARNLPFADSGERCNLEVSRSHAVVRTGILLPDLMTSCLASGKVRISLQGNLKYALALKSSPQVALEPSERAEGK